MMLFFCTSVLGWLACILVGVESLLPYLLRRTAFSQKLGTSDCTRPYLARMWAHYWIGYLLFPLASVHAWIPMAAGNARGANILGLWLATASLLLLFLQLLLGLALRSAKPIARRKIRPIHYWMMTAIAVTVVAHISLNR